MEINRERNGPVRIRQTSDSDIHIRKEGGHIGTVVNARHISGSDFDGIRHNRGKDSVEQIKSQNASRHVMQSRGRSIRAHKGSLKNGLKSAAHEALAELDGGQELNDSVSIVNTALYPVKRAGEKIYGGIRKSVTKKQQLKKAENAAKRTVKKAVKKAAKDTAKKTAKGTAKAATKETVKITAKVTAQAAVTAAGAATGPWGALVGYGAGKEAGKKIDQADLKLQQRRKIAKYASQNLKEGENKYSLGQMARDVILVKVMFGMKKALAYMLKTLGVLSLFILIICLPSFMVVEKLYNSPYQVYLPVLEGTYSISMKAIELCREFETEVNRLAEEHDGYETGKVVYIGHEEETELPLSFRTVVALYIAGYGGEEYVSSATEENEERLKEIFSDICSYDLETVSESYEDAEGGLHYGTVLYVNVTVRDGAELAAEYGFDDIQMDIFRRLSDTTLPFEGETILGE